MATKEREPGTSATSRTITMIRADKSELSPASVIMRSGLSGTGDTLCLCSNCQHAVLENLTAEQILLFALVVFECRSCGEHMRIDR